MTITGSIAKVLIAYFMGTSSFNISLPLRRISTLGMKSHTVSSVSLLSSWRWAKHAGMCSRSLHLGCYQECFSAPGGANKTMTGSGHTLCVTESACTFPQTESHHQKLERPSLGLILPLQSVAVSWGCHTREPLEKGSFSPSIFCASV